MANSYITALYQLSALAQTEAHLPQALQIAAEILECSVGAIHRGTDFISVYDPQNQSDLLHQATHSLSIALSIENVAFATLTFASPTPKSFSETEGEFGHLVGQWVSTTLEKSTLTSILQESETRFRQMAENIQEVFWMTDPAKNEMLYVSPAYERIWGRTVASLYANPSSFVEAIHEDDRARVMAAFSQQVLGTYDIEYRVVQPDATVRWVRDTAYPIAAEDGQVYRVVGVARDITSEFEQRQFMKDILNASPAYIFVKDYESRFVLANTGMASAYGSTPEGLIGKSDADFNPNVDETEFFKKADQAVIDSGKTLLIPEEPVSSADGITRWFQTTKVPITVGEQKLLVGIAVDISDRKAADEKLALSEAQYRSLVENSPDFIIVTDREYKIQFINNIQAPLTARQVIGMPVFAFVPPDYHAVMQQTVEQVFATGEPGAYEIIGEGAGGQFRWYSTRVIPIRQEDNTLETALLIASDITDRRQKDLQLEILNRLQQAILDNSDFTIITTLPDGTITLFNKAAEEKLGYRAEEVVGKTSPAIIHDLSEVVKRAEELSIELGHTVEPGFETFVAKANQLGVPDQNEWTYIRKDGTRFPVLLAVTAIRDENANVTGYLGIAADITERKEAEREREFLIKELEDALLFKDQFLATMSHELRTPLNAIQGYAGLIMMEDSDNADINHMAGRIDSNSRRLLSLINDILDISRINANRIEIVQRPVDLHSLVKNWYGDFAQVATRQNLNFDLELDPNLPTSITGDEERLTQITANLLQNAFKFTETGRVLLRVAAHSERSWQIIVSDTGPGIPQTWHYLIFDEFRQVDGSSRRKYGGAGLGLSIVKKLSSLMGGAVTVESTLGQGSTFIVTLPLKVVVPAQ